MFSPSFKRISFICTVVCLSLIPRASDYEESSRAAVPNVFGTSDEFRGRQVGGGEGKGEGGLGMQLSLQIIRH